MGSTSRRLRRASKNDLLYNIIKTTVLKNNPNDGLFCTFATRYCTRRVLGVPVSAKRRFYNRGCGIVLCRAGLLSFSPCSCAVAASLQSRLFRRGQFSLDDNRMQTTTVSASKRLVNDIVNFTC